jgi:hypothetical protein
MRLVQSAGYGSAVHVIVLVNVVEESVLDDGPNR